MKVFILFYSLQSVLLTYSLELPKSLILFLLYIWGKSFSRNWGNREGKNINQEWEEEGSLLVKEAMGSQEV